MINSKQRKIKQKLAFILIAIDALDPYVAKHVVQSTILDYTGLPHYCYVSKFHHNSWLYRVSSIQILKVIVKILSSWQIQKSIHLVLKELNDQTKFSQVHKKNNYLRRFSVNINSLQMPYIISLDNCLDLGSSQLAVYLLILMHNCSESKGIYYLLNYIFYD